MKRIINAIKIAYWAYKYQHVLYVGTFKLLSGLYDMILKVANENKPMMSHIGFIHPTEGEQEIVSLWAGTGLGADPVKRIAELRLENEQLKNEIVKHIKQTV